jgi:inorganic pyrophosphatase
VSRTIEVVVEIPKYSRNKYEIDHEKHIVRLDRRLFSAMTYPADYGFVPDTLAEDNDPLDALVLLEEPTVPGCYIQARPLGILWMEDEAGPDAKLICVVDGDPAYERVASIDDLPPGLLAEIRHFFDTYKDLEPNKSTSTKGYDGVDAAWQEIKDSQDRFVKTPAAH